jgi:2,5-furandicarboxylate decarboxylase 1
MNKGLSDFLAELKREKPESIVRIAEPVKLEYEVSAILQKLEKQKRHPAIIFENIQNLNGGVSKLPLLINLFGDRERIALAMNSTVEKVSLDYAAREKPVSPKIIPKSQAKVKEVIQTGEDVDLYELPVVTHHEMDLGPYLAASSVWLKDPETGWTNCAILRILVDGAKRLVINFNAARHTNYIFNKYKERNIEKIPAIIMIGHHPAFYMGSQTKILTNEPDIIGGIIGEPAELTASETWGEDLLVPAQAEIVVECEMSTECFDIEAPFGEYTGYYGGQRLNPVADVTAITRRADAYYLDIMPGHADHFLIDSPMIEAYLYNRIKEVVPGTKNVYMPTSGAARLHAYVQVKKSNDAEPKTVIACALSSDYRLKHVVVVDEDVNIYNDEEVLWAIATRSQWDKDLVVIKGIMGTRLDPSADGIITTKGGIDATMPFGEKNYPKRIAIPQNILAKIDLKKYICN